MGISYRRYQFRGWCEFPFLTNNEAKKSFLLKKNIFSTYYKVETIVFSTFAGEFSDRSHYKTEIYAKNLVIVESPAKAKTIEKFLGKDYKVLSSYGHIRDLKKKEFSIDVEKNFEPDYEIPEDKKRW